MFVCENGRLSIFNKSHNRHLYTPLWILMFYSNDKISFSVLMLQIQSLYIFNISQLALFFNFLWIQLIRGWVQSTRADLLGRGVGPVLQQSRQHSPSMQMRILKPVMELWHLFFCGQFWWRIWNTQLEALYSYGQKNGIWLMQFYFYTYLVLIGVSILWK